MTPCPSESCVVYIKRDVVGARALEKSKCHSDTREPRPHNRISVNIFFYVSLEVCDMFPAPQPPELAIYEPCTPSHFVMWRRKILSNPQSLKCLNFDVDLSCTISTSNLLLFCTLPPSGQCPFRCKFTFKIFIYQLV